MADGPEAPTETFTERLNLPWTRLFRAFALASNAKALILAAVGLVLVHAGWAGLDRVFSRTSPVPAPWTARVEFVPGDTAPIGRDPALTGGPNDPRGIWSRVRTAPWRLTEPVRALVGPFVTFFSPDVSTTAALHALLSAVWGVLVWATVGGAIARLALLQVSRSRTLNLSGAVRFALANAVHLAGGPLCPLLGIVVCVLVCALFGLVYWIPVGIGATAAGALAFVPLLAGLVMTVILVSLALGWPLMIPAVAAEGQDAFDALSRSFAYVNQRRGHYLAYVLLAVAAGTLGLIFVDVFALLVVRLAAWGLSFSAPHAAVAGLWTGAGTGPAAQVHGFWIGVVGLVVHGWIYSYFWSASAIVYLLLRRDVDGTPIHELDVPEEVAPTVEETEVETVEENATLQEAS